MLQIILALVLPLLQSNSPLENSLPRVDAQRLQVAHLRQANLGRLNRCDRAAMATLLQATGSAEASKVLLGFLAIDTEGKSYSFEVSEFRRSERSSYSVALINDVHVAHCRTRAGPLS